MIALYPGSFDPITFGHLDIIERGARLFDRLIVAVLKNPNKQSLFTTKQRLEQIEAAIRPWTNVEVSTFVGLTVTHARQQNATVLIRGLRAVSDFEFELQMAHTNKTLEPDLETIFLSCSTEHSFLSSSVVKEIARYGGPIDHLVPERVRKDLEVAFSQSRPLGSQARFGTESLPPRSS